MNITYTQNGDYLIPNIMIRKTKPRGHYGRLRKAYLEMHRPILFNELVLSCLLYTSIVADCNKYHPIRDYLNGLEWDGTERIRCALPHFLGAEESEFT